MKKVNSFLNIQVRVACMVGHTLTLLDLPLKVGKGTDLKKVHKTHRSSIFGEVYKSFPEAKHLTPMHVKHGAITKYRRTKHLHAHLAAARQ